MNIDECFYVLGIDRTDDEKLIKNAYRDKLSVTNPEDDPEGFKQLRQAYDTVLEDLKNADKKATLDEEDTSPVGLWIKKVENNYNLLSKRISIPCWEALFEDEIFDSIEGEEAAKERLLVFLMDNFRLPHTIWNFLNEKLEILNNEEDLRYKFPSNFIDFVIRNINNNDTIEFEDFKGADDANYDSFLEYYYCAWDRYDEENYEEVNKQIELAEKLDIHHPSLDVIKVLVLSKENVSEAATQLHKLLDEYPNNLTVSFQSSEFFWNNNEREAAVEIYKKLIESDNNHYSANRRLTEYYYETKDYSLAKKHAETVLSIYSDDEFMKLLEKINVNLEDDYLSKWKKNNDWRSALELCWCYFQNSLPTKALLLAKDIEKYIETDKITEYNGLLAKLYIDLGEFKSSLTYAKKWLEYLHQGLFTKEGKEKKDDEDRINQAHIIIMRSYVYLSIADEHYKKEALDEYNSIKDSIKNDINMRLEIAQIMTQLQEYDLAAGIADELVKNYGVKAAAYYSLLAYRGLWDSSGVYNNGMICINNFPEFKDPYNQLARLFFDTNNYDDLYELKKKADENKVESLELNAYIYLAEKHLDPLSYDEIDKYLDKFNNNVINKIAEGDTSIDYENAISTMKHYFNLCPSVYLYTYLANLYIETLHTDEAISILNLVISRAKDYTWPYLLLSKAYAIKADHEKSIYFRKLAALSREDHNPTEYDCSSIALHYLALGENEEAIKWCKKYITLTDKNNDHSIPRTIIDAYIRMQDKENVLRYLNEYVKLNNTDDKNNMLPSGYATMSEVLEDFGDNDLRFKNLMEYKKNVADSFKLKTKAPIDVAHYYDHLGWYYLGIGNYKDALDAFLKAKKINPYKTNDANVDSDNIIGLKGLLYGAILYNDKKTWEKYSRDFRNWLYSRSHGSQFSEYCEPKKWLYYTLLSKFFEYTTEELLEKIEEGHNSLNCLYCICPECMELNAILCLTYLHAEQYDKLQEKLDNIFDKMPTEAFCKPIQVRLNNILQNERL